MKNKLLVFFIVFVIILNVKGVSGDDCLDYFAENPSDPRETAGDCSTHLDGNEKRGQVCVGDDLWDCFWVSTQTVDLSCLYPSKTTTCDNTCVKCSQPPGSQEIQSWAACDKDGDGDIACTGDCDDRPKGDDNEPGKAGVDDDNLNGVDDEGEIGTPGTDDGININSGISETDSKCFDGFDNDCDEKTDCDGCIAFDALISDIPSGIIVGDILDLGDGRYKACCDYGTSSDPDKQQKTLDKWYKDDDGDDHGDKTKLKYFCPPSYPDDISDPVVPLNPADYGYLQNSDDCDDSDLNYWNNNLYWYEDLDNDYYTPSLSGIFCVPPNNNYKLATPHPSYPGRTLKSIAVLDCDDNPALCGDQCNPGILHETNCMDWYDNDCRNGVDCNDPSSCKPVSGIGAQCNYPNKFCCPDASCLAKKDFYRDADNDGDGDANDHLETCDAVAFHPPGYVDNANDCDDNDPSIVSATTTTLGSCGKGENICKRCITGSWIPPLVLCNIPNDGDCKKCNGSTGLVPDITDTVIAADPCKSCVLSVISESPTPIGKIFKEEEGTSCGTDKTCCDGVCSHKIDVEPSTGAAPYENWACQKCVNNQIIDKSDESLCRLLTSTFPAPIYDSGPTYRCCSGSCTDQTAVDNCGGCGKECCAGSPPSIPAQTCSYVSGDYRCTCQSSAITFSSNPIIEASNSFFSLLEGAFSGTVSYVSSIPFYPSFNADTKTMTYTGGINYKTTIPSSSPFLPGWECTITIFGQRTIDEDFVCPGGCPTTADPKPATKTTCNLGSSTPPTTLPP